jgi:hypothetical protein
MIKSFQKYFESVGAISFRDSDQYKSLIKKWGLSKDDIDNYFDDLNDDNIRIRYDQGIIDHEDKTKDISKYFSIKIVLYFKYKLEKIKSFDNYTTFLNLDSYNLFLKKQIDTLEKIESSVNRFIDGENLKLESKYSSGVPFYLSQDERRNEMSITYRLSFEVESDDLVKSIKEYTNTPNPLGEAKDIVVNKLINKYGIKPEFADTLIDAHPDYHNMVHIPIGFLTDGEIIVIANFNVEMGKVDFYNNELNRSIEYFYDGYCADILGEDYLNINES